MKTQSWCCNSGTITFFFFHIRNIHQFSITVIFPTFNLNCLLLTVSEGFITKIYPILKKVFLPKKKTGPKRSGFTSALYNVDVANELSNIHLFLQLTDIEQHQRESCFLQPWHEYSSPRLLAPIWFPTPEFFWL